MKIDRVVDVERREQCENIGLDRADQQLERADPGDEHERQQADRRSHRAVGVQTDDDEIAEHLDQDVACDHRHEQSQRQAERPHQERDELDRHDQQLEQERRAGRHEQREEVEAMLPEADDQHDSEADDRHHPRLR